MNIAAAFIAGAVLGVFLAIVPFFKPEPHAAVASAQADSEKANWASIAVKIGADIDAGKPLDGAEAEAAIEAARYEAQWADRVFGKVATPPPGWKVFSSVDDDGRATVLVIDPKRDTVTAFRGTMVGHTQIFDIIDAAPAGLYDKGDPRPTAARERQVYADAIGILMQWNAKFLPPAPKAAPPIGA